MKRNKKFLTAFGIILTVLLLTAMPLAAQNSSDPMAFLVYYEDDFELEVFDSSGNYVGDVFLGMELFPGSTIKTYNTTAEIQLDPNGSILKISENSVFQIEAFQRSADESNDFSLFNGKLRVIAARAGLGFENYSIITQSAVCGVRGTDFVIDSIGVVAVKEGKVEFSSLLSGGTVDVIAGQMADVFADTFKATAASAQALSSIFSGMDFKGTDPGQVPGHTPAPTEPEAEEDNAAADDDQPVDDEGTAENDEDDQNTAEEPADTAEAESGEEEQPADIEAEADDTTGEVEAAPETVVEEPRAERETPKPSRTGSAAGYITGNTRPAATDEDTEEDTEEPETETEKEPGPAADFLDALGDMLGFEIGSILIDGTTYAKALIQPEFEIGKFKAKLYLPVIYQDNLFDPESWYFPAGNNEWSFGTDQSEAVDIAFDIVNDLFLKINYLQWGDNGDDFYFKFGNLNNMTIGHGILMRNFSNNIEFPAVRKVGINTGVNFENFGFEAVLDNAASPTIFGGRLVYIPFGSSFPMGIGLSAITDINPDSEVETSSSPTLWDPLVLNAAFDLGFPISLLNMTLFAEAAGLVVYDTNLTPNNNGWHTETVYNPDEADILTALNNYGVAAGIYGDLFSLDYRLEYRLSKGIFTPGFYANNYLINKTAQYSALTAFINNPTDPAYQSYTMGVYGDLSVNILDAVTVGGGYLWPWEIDSSGAVDFTADDSFNLSLELMPDVIPLVGIYGSLSYTRTGLVNDIKDAVDGTNAFQLFSEDSILTGELVYPFDPSLDIALQVATSYTRDDDGDLFINPDGSLDTYFAMSIDMRVHF